MLYPNIEQYTPSIDSQKDGTVLLDISMLSHTHFQQYFAARAEELREDAVLLQQRFEDTLICSEDLHSKVNTVILPVSSFQRKFSPVDQQGLYVEAKSPFHFLIKKYELSLTIGVKVDWNSLAAFQQLRKASFFKKIKVFSFEIRQETLGDDFPRMRNLMRQLTNFKEKTRFHINIHLSSAEGLRLLKEELIVHEYPLQLISLQTNLLWVIEKQFNLNMDRCGEQISFKYVEAVGKYVPAAIGCLLDFYPQASEGSWRTVDRILTAISLSNQRTEKGERISKPHHSSGVAMPECLLRYLAMDFSRDEYDHYRVKGQLDLIGYGKLYEASIGRYKSPQHLVEEGGEWQATVLVLPQDN